jgi:hypothetical protein
MKRFVAMFLFLTSFAAFAQKPADAVIYIERPEAGPQAKSGREIRSSSGVTIHGLDVNSGVEVKIDPFQLAAALRAAGVGTLTPQQQALLDRITTLHQVMSEIDVAAEELNRVFALFDTATAADFRAARGRSSGQLLAIRRTLRRAIAQRLVSEGMSQGSADDRALDDMADMGGTDKDWPKLRALVARELDAAERDFNASAPDMGVSVELQAHLVPRAGDPVAIALPGHNTVTPGPVSRYEKIRFEVPADQQQLFTKLTELAAKTTEVNGAGDALLFALRSDVANSELQEQLDKVKAGFDDVKTLANAIDRQSIQATLTQLRNSAVATNNADAQLLTQLTALVNQATAVKTTLTQLANVSQFATSLRAAPDPVTAMNQILGQFRAAAGLTSQLRNVGRDLQGLKTAALAAQTALGVAGVTNALRNAVLAPASPFAPLVGPNGAVATLIADTERLGEMVETFFTAETTAIAVSDLPVPEGQKRIPVLADANTSFNLQTINAPRAPGDNVRLSYAFYTGDDEVPSTAWADTFALRAYGLSDKVTASMALIRRLSESKFKPTAAMSWLLGYERWPRTADDQVRGGVKMLSGIGLTTMALEFDENETVELGVAPTIGFLNNRILLGYGWNLQAAQDRTYAFFSIQLFSRKGMLGSGGGAAQ